MSERFVQLMIGIGATGYKTYEAVVDLDGEACDDYRALGVSGRAGPVNWNDTPVVPAMAENGMPLGGYDYMGLAFDVATWDGSDFFTTKGNAYILITSKVANAIIEANLTNVRCTPLKEFRQVYDGDDF